MKKLFSVALGILTAIGGFVDIGDLVTNAQVGARLGWSLGLVVMLGVLGICVFAEMSGRVAAVSSRATFDLVRERLGPRVGLLNLFGSMAVTLLTFIAEIGGVALSVQLLVSVHHVLLVPLVAVLVWLILWKAKFSLMENVLGMLGLALVVFVVALWQLDPDWGHLTDQLVTVDKPSDESWPVWAYYAVALFGAALTPYEVFFFSSGGVEERWTEKDLSTMRLNVFIGFPLGGVLSLAIAGCTAVVFGPLDTSVDTLGQVGLPVAVALGKVGLAVAILGFVAATLGAACETGLSTGYSIAQYFGWQWGKYVQAAEASRFHLTLIAGDRAGHGGAGDRGRPDPGHRGLGGVLGRRPAADVLPDPGGRQRPRLHGRARQRPARQRPGMIYLVLIGVAAAAAIPLMVWTRMGA